jgi:hypothetical protein
VRAGLAVVAAVLVGVPSAFAGEPVHVDGVAAYGGVEPDDARAIVAEAVRASGLEPVLDLPSDGGARLVVRVTIAQVAGELLASVDTVDRRGRPLRSTVSAATRDALVRELARLFAATVASPTPRRVRSGWIVAGAAGALALSGAVATWHAYDIRGDFFDNHVDANGDVFGITVDEARREETRAQRWSAVGIVLLAGAAASGIAATVLLVRSPDGEARPAGVMVGGRF